MLQLHPNPAGERRGHAGLVPLRLLTVRGPEPGAPLTVRGLLSHFRMGLQQQLHRDLPVHDALPVHLQPSFGSVTDIVAGEAVVLISIS